MILRIKVLTICFLLITAPQLAFLKVLAYADLENVLTHEGDFQVENDPVIDAKWNLDDSRLAITRLNSGVYIYDPSLQLLNFIETRQRGGAAELEWSPTNSELLAIILENLPYSPIEVWNIQTMTMVFSAEVYLADFPNISWSPDGVKLAIMGGSAEVWDITTGNKLFSLNLTGELAEDRLFEGRWNPVQDIIATDGVEGETVFWDATNGQQIASIPYGGYLAWSPNGNELALLDYTVQIYDLSLEGVTYSFPFVGEYPRSITWRGDTLVFLSVVLGGNHFVEIIDTTAYQIIDTIELAFFPEIALTSDGSILIIVNRSAVIEVIPIMIP